MKVYVKFKASHMNDYFQFYHYYHICATSHEHILQNKLQTITKEAGFYVRFLQLTNLECCNIVYWRTFVQRKTKFDSKVIKNF